MQSYTPNIQRLVTAISPVAASAESAAISVTGAKKITLAMTRADHGSGSSAFSVTGTVDGVNYVTLNRLMTNVVNSNTQDKIRSASVSLGADGTEFAEIDMDGLALLAIKVAVTETTDGTHSAKLLIQT